MFGKLQQPRAAWVMVPAGGPTEQVVTALADRLDRDDTNIDRRELLLVIDRDGQPVGKVDDVELTCGDTGVPYVSAVLPGQQVLGERIGGPLGRCIAGTAGAPYRLGRMCWASEPAEVRVDVPLSRRAEFDQSDQAECL
jgi:hypothetical protein